MSEERLQRRLEKLEAGVSLERCLSGLSEEEADLLKQAAFLKSIEFPERDAMIVKAQREQFLDHVPGNPRPKARSVEKDSNSRGSLKAFRWLPAVAITGAIILFGMFSLLALTIGGIHVFRQISTAFDDRGEESEVLIADSQDLAGSPAYLPPDQSSAVLNNVRGFINVQRGDGGWEIAEAGTAVSKGGRIKTGALSSATLLFYDGSEIFLGPDTEITLDEIDAPRPPSPRTIMVNQATGSTDHEVAQSGNAVSTYKVITPFGVGEAKGTTFTVFVSLLFARFDVDEGAVAVTNLEITIIVLAGESSTVRQGQTPEEPVFRVVGEGEITAIGDSWVISGQSFVVDSSTIIVGDPQVGDWVYVEGRLLPDGTKLADKIILLRRAAENSFKTIGTVEEIGEELWIIAGHEITITEDTAIEDGIVVDDVVVVIGSILDDGSLVAETIRSADHRIFPFEFIGVVQAMDESWLISDIEILIEESTEIIGEIELGDLVKVEGWILEDDTWVAAEIKLGDPDDRKFEFVGVVENIDPWVISGIEIATREWTEIETGIDVSDTVKVEGLILENGSWLADEIKLVHEEEGDDPGEIIFEITGQVESIDPWEVSGFSISVDDQTVIEAGISIDDLVKVVGIILEDGSLLAKTIQRIEENELGCFTFVTIVSRVDGNIIVLVDGTRHDLSENVMIEGDLEIGSVISITICTAEDGTVTVVVVIVLFQLDQPPGDDDTGVPSNGKAVICHIPPGNPGNRRTKTVGQAAVSGHLGHGDTLGPCP